MRTALLLIPLAVMCSVPAFASEPGQRLMTEDIVMDLSELHSEPFLPPLTNSECARLDVLSDPPADPRCFRAFTASNTDADGSFYFFTRAYNEVGYTVATIWRTRRDGTTEHVAHIEERPAGTTFSDLAIFRGLYIDSVRGHLYVVLFTSCFPSTDPSCPYEPADEIVRVTGLKSLLQVLREQIKRPIALLPKR